MLLGLIAAPQQMRPLSRLRVRVSPQWDSPSGKRPHPALRAHLSRKRERLSGPAAAFDSTNSLSLS